MTMKTLKLSETQYIMLEYDQYLSYFGRTIEDGWFRCRFTQMGSLDFFSRPQTAKSLCGMGLLEYRADSRWTYKKNGRWVTPLEFRIKPEGIQFLESQKVAQAQT
jgi:hypothetical protein